MQRSPVDNDWRPRKSFLVFAGVRSADQDRRGKPKGSILLLALVQTAVVLDACHAQALHP